MIPLRLGGIPSRSVRVCPLQVQCLLFPSGKKDWLLERTMDGGQASAHNAGFYSVDDAHACSIATTAALSAVSGQVL